MVIRLQCRGCGFDPWSGNEDPTCHVVWPKGKEKLRKKKKRTPPSRAGRDASGRKNGAGRFFSLLQMGANNSSLTPLNCILKNWDRFDPQGLKKTHLVFLCDTAWPQYPLEDGEPWPVGGSLKYNTVLQLDWFCKEQGK